MSPTRVLATLLLSACAADAAAQTNSLQTLTGCCGFGWAVSTLRDVDGDGITDAIVGANENGHVYVYSGRTGVQLRDFSLASSDLGHAVADAGDVDGDGIDDVVAGSPSFGPGGTIRVYSGRTGAQLLAVDAPAANGRFGQAVSGAGDLNGDGRADLLVGADNGPGRAYVLSGVDGSIIRTLQGTIDGRRFGAGVARLRDVSGDGVPELLVSAVDERKAYVVSGASGAVLFTSTGDGDSATFGEFFIADAGDVDGDGKSDVYVGDYGGSGNRGIAYVFSGADGHRLFRFTGVANEGLGPGRSAGDVDGDGRADLIVGGYTFGGGGVAQGGRATVYSGRTGAVLSVFNGGVANGNFGFDAVGIGDVNNDRRLDFLVSSATANRVDIVSGTIALPSTPTFDINAAITGAWYDPAQAGHGLFLEVLPNGQLLAWWFTFDPQGNQAWFGGVGPITGNRAVIPVTRTTGGRFIPNFDASNITNPLWGTLTFTFSTCNTGLVEFTSTLGFGTGSMALSRLTLPLGESCP